jgi:hypothetical protein
MYFVFFDPMKQLIFFNVVARLANMLDAFSILPLMIRDLRFLPLEQWWPGSTKGYVTWRFDSELFFVVAIDISVVV